MQVQATQMGSFVTSSLPMNTFKTQSECEHYEQSKTNSTNIRSQYFLHVTQDGHSPHLNGSSVKAKDTI